MKDRDKYRGCLIGGAAGDALGYPVEFMKASSIYGRYGNEGITCYDLDGDNALISDDTQMTLFTATGIMLGATRGGIRGIAGPPWGYIHYSLRDWYRTQTERYPLSEDLRYSWLDDIPELFSRRAPGSTCLSVLSSEKAGSVDSPINDSKGCGGVMRVAPVGLYFGDKKYHSVEEIDRIGAEAAALTHGHPLGYIPAAALVHIIALVSHSDMPLRSAVDDMLKAIPSEFPADRFTEYFISIISYACDLAASSRISDIEAIEKLGEGWVAEEALAIAVYCALRYHDDFDQALIAAVNHDGDSDSTGAITGNILGACLGFNAIPEKYIEHLELRDLIIEIADDLYHDCPLDSWNIAETPDEIKWENKYSHFDKYYQE